MLILLRHATPIIEYNRCGYKTAKDRIRLYNNTDQIKISEIDSYVDEIRNKVRDRKKLIIYASGLARSQKTAEYLFRNSDIQINFNSIFSEFDLNILKIPFIKLSTRNWFLFSRLVWFLGIHMDAKSFSYEKKRAKESAKLLENKINQGNTVILVGHGLINKFIESHFKKIGCFIEKGAKNGCFEIKTIKKINTLS